MQAKYDYQGAIFLLLVRLQYSNICPRCGRKQIYEDAIDIIDCPACREILRMRKMIREAPETAFDA